MGHEGRGRWWVGEVRRMGHEMRAVGVVVVGMRVWDETGRVVFRGLSSRRGMYHVSTRKTTRCTATHDMMA
jgi:hypothetical protein